MSKLDLLIEAERRGILPEDKKALLAEARNRGLVASGDPKPSPDLPTGVARYGWQFKNAMVPGADIIGGAGEAAIASAQGDQRPYADIANEKISRNWLISDKLNEDNGVLDYAAKAGGMVAGGLGLGKIIGSTAAEIPAAASHMQRLWQISKESGRVMGAFGALQGALDSRATDTAGRVADQATGLVGGATIGTLFPAVFEGIVGIRDAMRKAGNWIAGTTPEQRAANQAVRQEFADAGVRPIPTAVTDGPIANATARNAAGSIAGGDMRDVVRNSVSDAQRAAEMELRMRTGGVPLNDQGAEIQSTLRDKLIRRSRSEPEVRDMSIDRLEGMTGPVGDGGFSVPRPVVRPVQPEPVTPVAPQRVDPSTLDVPPVRPQPVQRPNVEPNYPKVDDIAFAPEHQKAIMGAENGIRAAQVEEKQARDIFNAEARRAGLSPEDHWKQMWQREAKISFERGVEIPETPQHPTLARLHAAMRNTETAEQNLSSLKRAAEADQTTRWRASVAEEQARAQSSAEQSYAQAQARAQAEAEQATEVSRMRATLKAQTDANASAEAQTARLRVEAQGEAERATQRAQAHADAQWERDKATRPGFEFGRSRESYPTEASAAYERVARETPSFQRNPLGGPGPSGSATRTNTERVLDQFAQEGRTSMKIPGYKDGRLFEEDGAMRPDLRAHLRELLGPEVSGRIEAFGASRQRGRMTPGIDGLRDLRTAIRREAQRAERPPYPEQPRTESAAALRRLEGALKDDITTFMRSTGPHGERAAAMWDQVDRQYAEHLNTMRKPLAQIFGEKVEPLHALEKLADAAQEGNLSLLRPFMRVMTEKGDPTKAAASIITQATQGAKTFREFIDGFGRIGPEARGVLFASPEGKAMRASLERLERIGKRILPYEKAAASDNSFGLLAKNANLQAMTGVGLAASTGGLPVAIMSAVLNLGSQKAISKLLSSPKYLNWVTRSETVRTPTQARAFFRQFVNMAQGDADVGKQLIHAVADVFIPNQAKASDLTEGDAQAQERTPELDRVMQAAARRGIDVRRASPEQVFEAAWDAEPSDTMGETIDQLSRQYGVKPPWAEQPAR